MPLAPGAIDWTEVPECLGVGGRRTFSLLACPSRCSKTTPIEIVGGFDSRRLHLSLSSSSVEFCLKRGRIWRRLCLSVSGCPV
jgi:hypothetical protein